MSGDPEISNAVPTTAPQPDLFNDESLTDVIDRIKRRAFLRALERRPPDAYRRTIEATHLVRAKSS
jgi:hypothetical protein